MKITLKNINEFSKSKNAKVFFIFNNSRNKAKKQISNRFLKIVEPKNIEIFILDDLKKNIIFNLGNEEGVNLRKIRLFARKIILILKEKKIEKSDWFLEDILLSKRIRKMELVKEIFENIVLANYDFNKYKEKKEKIIKEINIYLLEHNKYKKILKNSLLISSAVNFSRDLINIPGSEMTPKKLAEIARENFRNKNEISLEIFDKKKISKNKFGGIIGVSKGSKEDPRFIIIKYFGKKKNSKFDLSFIGKGVTFDSGGLNIKTGNNMVDMYMDMAGAGAVLGALKAIVSLKIPLNIVVAIPAVENMPSSESYRPGDLLRTFSGKTIEVLNTDAEGRIILADALSYVEKKFKPKLMVDLATLTGAAIVALGQRAIAVFSNNNKLEGKLKEIGELSGDYIWPMPLWEEYEEEIKGTFGDVKNIGSTRYGGAIIGAIFLKQFIKKIDWVHMDIAPTMSSIESDYLAKGASGTGVRFLVSLAENFANLWR